MPKTGCVRRREGTQRLQRQVNGRSQPKSSDVFNPQRAITICPFRKFGFQAPGSLHLQADRDVRSQSTLLSLPDCFAISQHRSSPVISIMIGSQRCDNVICDLGAGVNIMPRVICDEVLNSGPLLYTTMRLRFADQTTRHVDGLLEDICVRIGNSYVPADFAVIHTRTDLKAPIVLGRPFLYTAKATIYTASSSICFNIMGKKERFTFAPPKPRTSRRMRGRRARRTAAHPESPEVIRVGVTTAVTTYHHATTSRTL